MNTTNPFNFSTIQQVIRSWRDSLNQRGIIDDDVIITRIIAAGLTGDNHNQWEKDKNFATVLDNASDLDWDNGSPQVLADLWEEIDICLEILERRYHIK